MKVNFLAKFKVDGQAYQQPMQYDTKEIEATLRRRLTTAFANATEVEITLDEPTNVPHGKKP